MTHSHVRHDRHLWFSNKGKKKFTPLFAWAMTWLIDMREQLIHGKKKTKENSALVVWATNLLIRETWLFTCVTRHIRCLKTERNPPIWGQITATKSEISDNFESHMYFFKQRITCAQQIMSCCDIFAFSGFWLFSNREKGKNLPTTEPPLLQPL